MPLPTFRGDPFRVLGADPDASDAALKRLWRDLVREHHPDRATDPAEAARLTRKVARINAAYDALRDPIRRADYRARSRASGWHDHGDGWGPGAGDWAGRDGVHATGTPGGGHFAGSRDPRPPGPPPPRPKPPVTAHFDTTPVYHRRNAPLKSSRSALRGHRPLSARDIQPGTEAPRASDPTGPVHRRRGGRRPRLPSLEQSRGTVLEFGRFRGHTLGQVEGFEPTYIDWLARTITRDRDLVMAARVIQADMDDRGVERRRRTDGT
jgi:curved DNA-binding protein CbpA